MIRRLLSSLSLAPVALFALACASSSNLPQGAGGAGQGGTGTGGSTLPSEDEICLLSNCSSDAECAACDGGRTHCRLEDARCVACDADTATGCPDGEYCSSYGNCVPEGVTCPTDAQGEPQITCETNADCLACDPMHQVCDPASNTCVACTTADTSHCQSTDICLDGRCSPKCPSSCTVDNDCSQCGAPGHEAHACNAHKCAECSPTYACPAGLECQGGVCVAVCGSDGEGACDGDADCATCGGGSTKCHQPLNGGPGVCGVEASGCSDLGQGVVVLPDPWNDYTNTCSNDGDCAGVGVEYNVGKLLRDLTGIDQIGDAVVEYPMSQCAALTVGSDKNSVSCGICVPCEVDSDCMNLDIDAFAGDLFGGIGSVLASFVLDQLFGNQAHEIHMYCQPVAAGYGVCAPCPGLLSACGEGSAGGGGGGSGTCEHEPCDQGTALDPACDACAADVCAVDGYCCDGANGAWDAICVNEAKDICGLSCSGGGGGGCLHDECTAGVKLTSGCSSCVTTVCAADAYCCNTEWDSQCVSGAIELCGGLDCGGGGGSCAHDECTAGAKLTDGCSSCVTEVCDADSFCCSSQWDQQCVDAAESLCGLDCGGGGGNDCAHDECTAGAALTDGCSACVTAVCDVDSFCCSSEWDQQCVNTAEIECGLSC